MSYSNRPGYRPDPTVAPIMFDPVTQTYKLRPPFTPSIREEGRRRAQKEARERNRKGVAYHNRGR